MSLKNKLKCVSIEFNNSIYESKCVLSDRVIPLSISPIDYARGNGSSNSFTFEPLQLTKIKLSSIKCITPKEIISLKNIPTIKLK